jgi:hypothetical protein
VPKKPMMKEPRILMMMVPQGSRPLIGSAATEMA